jgi:hypothetical protein
MPSANSHASFRGAGSAGKCTQPAQAWLRVPANPESITTGSGYGFRLSPLSRLGRNDEQKGSASSAGIRRRDQQDRHFAHLFQRAQDIAALAADLPHAQPR